MKHSVTDVFTPTKPARLTFVEREEINLQIVDALKTPGKQVIVYGPSGSGKTTLLVNKLHQAVRGSPYRAVHERRNVFADPGALV